MSDRTFTPHELRQKSISILDQLERIAADWRDGRLPAATEVDAVTGAVATLCAHVERAALALPRGDHSGTTHLLAARRHVDAAVALVDALTGERAGGGVGGAADRSVAGAEPGRATRPDR